MSLSQHIQQNIFEERLQESRILVVYDAENRYQEICKGMENEHCSVIITEKAPVSSRMKAMARWQELLADDTNQSQLLIHCSESAPRDDEDRRHNPFASFAALGALFPSKASDNYHEICKLFLPDRITEINQLFEAEETPGFQLIDSLQSGSHAHPHLETIFDSGDVSRIIPEFLVPRSNKVNEALGANQAWLPELSQLLQRTLGLNLSAKVTNPETIRNKLWSFILFSEFAEDLPCNLPSTLAEIPRASDVHVGFAKSLCQELRKHKDTMDAYRDHANDVERDLNLVDECREIQDLGCTDTFSFEEKYFLHRACLAIRSKQHNEAKDILETHRDSLWTQEGERRLLWRILELSLLTLEEMVKSKEMHLPNLGSSGADLCAGYLEEMVKVDKAYREMESATAELVDFEDEVEDIVAAVRVEYRKHFNLLQKRFLSDVDREGWPLEKMSGNSSTYNRLVAPELRNGKRVVYFHIDALRLDLAQDLSQSLIGHQSKLSATCAQLPCVTKYAMASLLPDAETQLSYKDENSKLVPYLGDDAVATRSARMASFTAVLGDRVASMNLEDFIQATRTTKKQKEFGKKYDQDLLVVTSTEIDEKGEGASTSNLQFLPAIMRNLKSAIERCGGNDLAYDVAVIATDHGFIWAEDMGPDSTVEKPAGEWVLSKRRSLLGTGDDSPSTQKLSSESVGIPTTLPSFVTPKALATFKQGSGYFHEGLSLQESLLPQLVVKFERSGGASANQSTPEEIILNRKKATVSSRIVSMILSWPGTPDMLAEPFELKLVATQGGNEVGFPTSHEKVDSMSGLVRVQQGDTFKINLKLGDGAQEGPIKVKAINPQTDKILHTFDLTFKSHVF